MEIQRTYQYPSDGPTFAQVVAAIRHYEPDFIPAWERRSPMTCHHCGFPAYDAAHPDTPITQMCACVAYPQCGRLLSPDEGDPPPCASCKMCRACCTCAPLD